MKEEFLSNRDNYFSKTAYSALATLDDYYTRRTSMNIQKMTEVADVGRQFMKMPNVDGKWSTISMTISTIDAEHSDENRHGKSVK